MNLFIYLIIFLLPTYLVKFKIGFAPFNILEILIWISFVAWLIRKKYPNIPGLAFGLPRAGPISQYLNIVLPSLLILLGAIVSTLLSQDIVASAGILKSWVLTPMAFGLIVFTEAKSEKDAKWLLGALFTSSFAVAVVALIYFALGRLTFDGRLSAFYLSPNHLAMYLAPGLIIGIGLLGSKSLLTSLCKREELPPLAKEGGGGFIKKAMIIFGLIFITAALYLTFSYAAWISVLAAILFFFLLMDVIPGLLARHSFSVGGTRDPDLDSGFRSPRCSFGEAGRNDKKIRHVVIFILLILFLFVILFFSQAGSQKLNNLLNSERSSWQSRLMIWQAALEIGRDHPIFGIGPGEFGKYYLAYQSRFSVPYLEWAVPQPHNIFLAFWLQTGLLGLAGFLWLQAAFFKNIYLLIKQKNQTALVLVGLMIYILLHGLVDTTFWKNDLAVVFWLIVALATAKITQTDKTQRDTQMA